MLVTDEESGCLRRPGGRFAGDVPRRRFGGDGVEGEGGSEPAADGHVDTDRGLGTNVYVVDAEGGAGAPGDSGDH